MQDGFSYPSTFWDGSGNPSYGTLLLRYLVALDQFLGPNGRAGFIKLLRAVRSLVAPN